MAAGFESMAQAAHVVGRGAKARQGTPGPPPAYSATRPLLPQAAPQQQSPQALRWRPSAPIPATVCGGRAATMRWWGCGPHWAS